MEKKNFLIIGIGLLFSLVFNQLEAAPLEKNSNFSVGVCVGMGTTQDKHLQKNLAFALKTDIRRAKHYFSVRITRILPSCRSYDPIGDLGVLYGLVLWDDKESGSISAGVGIGFSNYKSDKWIGLPLEIQLNLRHFLLYAFGNVNSGSSFVGVGVGFRIGHF